MATVMLIPAIIVTIVINVHFNIFLNLFIFSSGLNCGGKIVRGKMMEKMGRYELRKAEDELGVLLIAYSLHE